MRVDRFVFVDSQRGAGAGDETAAGERWESPGLAAVGADLVSALPAVGKFAADLLDEFLELLAGEVN